MDLQLELIKAIIRKGLGGHRDLAPNEFRDSQVVKGARALYYDKLHPEPLPDPDNPREGREFYTDRYGIIHVHGGKAVVGTIIHEFIQSQLGHLILNSEELLTRERDGITRTGHVDLEYDDDSCGPVISDIKTANVHVIEASCRGAKPGTYTAVKEKSSMIQGNEYAVAKQFPLFNILWASRDELAFKIDWFETDTGIDGEIHGKLERVLAAVKARVPPGDCENGMCDLDRGNNTHYCRHHRFYAGWDKSPANCPGRLALAEARENRKLDDDYIR